MKKSVIVVIVLLILGFLGYKYIYHGQRDISSEETNFTVSLKNLEDELIANEQLFNKKYLDQTIEVQGVVTEVDVVSNAILLDNKIFATFENKLNNEVSVNKKLKIKARFIGYDDLLEKFRFDQVSLIK